MYEENKKRHSRNRMLVRMWKAIKVMFSCSSPTKQLLKLIRKDVKEFAFLSDMDEKGSDALSLGDNATSQMSTSVLVCILLFLDLGHPCLGQLSNNYYFCFQDIYRSSTLNNKHFNLYCLLEFSFIFYYRVGIYFIFYYRKYRVVLQYLQNCNS